MFVANLVKYLALSNVLVVGGIAGSNSIAAQFQVLRKQIESYNSSISNYDGSFKTMVPVAMDSIKVHQATRKARKVVEDADPVRDEDAPALIQEIGKTHEAMKDTLDSAATKDQIADTSGFKQVAALMVIHFTNEQKAMSDALKGKLPQVTHGEMEPTQNEATEYFNTVLKKFS
ncbi:hypothetical protein ETB97_008993 [Aspergillus alliaceus]|uniref:Uncharacterized protein n=1 Tax=Petromyces alliaceus TaxID=209559 RepID=A0A8H6E287_PETAA|nr:hypothetical protein ETB97_008993 [Aspergillus burnettii]